MECDACRGTLLEYLDGDLAGPGRGEVEAHLAHCPGCREQLQELQETLALIARIPAPEPPEAFWQQYLRELRQKVAAVERRPRLRNWLPTLLLRPVPALAVGTALILAVFLTWTLTTERPPLPQLASLAFTQELALSQDLDLLQEMELMEAVELLEDWELIRFRVIQGPRKAT
ncbi:MAG: zf-HC2 domain-containing protein [Candidatus Binatia bacterium]